jgi:hypothetical protein
VYAALLFCLLAAFASDKPYLAAEFDFGACCQHRPPTDRQRSNEIQAVLDMQSSLTPRRLARIQADTAVSFFGLSKGFSGRISPRIASASPASSSTELPRSPQTASIRSRKNIDGFVLSR